MKAIHSMAITVAIAALLSFSAPVPAFSEMRDMSARDHRDGHGLMMGMGSNMDRMDDMLGMCIEHADKMGLTDDQMEKIKPLHRDMQKKQVRFNADQKIAGLELMEIMEVKDFDLEKAHAAVKTGDELKTAHHLEMLKAMKEMRSILTDEQFNKMKKMMPLMKSDKKHSKKAMKRHTQHK